MFPGLELLKADRNESLDVLKTRHWDVVIDTCAYFPNQLDLALDALGGNFGHYVFISTISVYADLLKPSQPDAITEDSERLTALADAEEVTPETYGRLKVACEDLLKNRLPGSHASLRPGLVVGPFDHTDRFAYFTRRLSEGGQVLLPADADRPLQYIDASDLASFTLNSAEQTLTGNYNVVVPPGRYSYRDWFELAVRLSGSSAQTVAVPPDFLAEQDVGPRELPIYVPPSYANLMNVSSARALTAGLEVRSLRATVQGVLDYLSNLPAECIVEAGLSSEREAELIQAWRASA